MKKIYFVLTDTGTMLSRIIKFFMKDEYAHISLSLDKDLNHMYSFGRLNPYNPFIGGFIHESTRRGTFKRFKNTRARITVLNVTDEQYEKLRFLILNIKHNRKSFSFNVLGLFAIYFKIKLSKKRCFYCAEFIKYITEKSEIDLNLPELIRPEDFRDIANTKVVYLGLLQAYNKRLLVTNKE